MVTGRVEVRLKRGVADPEGENTRKALDLLGFPGVNAVRSVKVFEIDLDVSDPKEGRRLLEEMSRRLLANPVIHDYDIQLLETSVERPA